MARAKPGAEAVRWLQGDATTLPALHGRRRVHDANVAQVFLTDDDWQATLRVTRQALRPGGHLVFETRDPARRAWEQWTPELTRTVVGRARASAWSSPGRRSPTSLATW